MQHSPRFNDAAILPDVWNDLVSASLDRTVFQTYEWCAAWWDAFGERFSPQVFTARDAEAIVGLAPFMISRNPLGLRQVEFLANGRADYHGLTARPGYEPAVARALVQTISGSRDQWDMVILENLPRDSQMSRLLRTELASTGLHYFELDPVACPAVILHGYEKTILERLDRYSIRRKIRSIQGVGPVRYDVVNGDEAVSALLPTLFDQHRRRWNALGQRSQFEDEQTRSFFRSLALALDRKGWLHFSKLTCGKQVVACHLGFQYCGRLYWYKPSFDPSYSRHSPGLVLLHYLVKDAVERGLDEFDFTVGAESFKLRFANEIRTNARIRVFHNRTYYAAALAYGRARRESGRCLRRAREFVRGGHTRVWP